jgi:hypothetical protein
MARKQQDEDLLMEDELTAAFLGEEEFVDTTPAVSQAEEDNQPQVPAATNDEWDVKKKPFQVS